MGDAGIVDQDGDGPEGASDGIEGLDHRGAVEHIGFHRDGAAASRLDLLFHLGEALGAPRDEHHGCSVRRQHLGEAHAETA